MKNFITKKAISVGIGMGIGSAIYGYFDGNLDWKRPLFITIFAIIILSLLLKKSN